MKNPKIEQKIIQLGDLKKAESMLRLYQKNDGSLYEVRMAIGKSISAVGGDIAETFSDMANALGTTYALDVLEVKAFQFNALQYVWRWLAKVSEDEHTPDKEFDRLNDALKRTIDLVTDELVELYQEAQNENGGAES